MNVSLHVILCYMLYFNSSIMLKSNFKEKWIIYSTKQETPNILVFLIIIILLFVFWRMTEEVSFVCDSVFETLSSNQSNISLKEMVSLELIYKRHWYTNPLLSGHFVNVLYLEHFFPPVSSRESRRCLFH